MQSSITSPVASSIIGCSPTRHGAAPEPAPVTAPTAQRSAAPAKTFDWGFPNAGGRIADMGRAPGSNAMHGATLATAQAELKDIRGFFSKLGVKDHEGNDATTIEIDPDYPNAAYLPSSDSLLIGVDPTSGTSFVKATDVLVHEWSHRIVHHLAFDGRGSTGPEDAAIDESLADTFAAAYDTDDWTLGEELGDPVRNMQHPERDTAEHAGGHPGSVADFERMFQPGSDYMEQVRTTTGQLVEVPESHALSAIPSKAASIIGEALGRDTMAKIYMKTVRDYLKPGKEIEGLAAGTIKSAADLFGASSNEVAVTKRAWDTVGVLELIKPEHQ